MAVGSTGVEKYLDNSRGSQTEMAMKMLVGPATEIMVEFAVKMVMGEILVELLVNFFR